MNTQKRFESAVEELGKISNFTLNVMECCRGCITHELLGIKENDPYTFTYGGQDNELIWVNGWPKFLEEELEEECHCEDEQYEYDEDSEEDVLVSEAFTCESCSGNGRQRKEISAENLHFYFSDVAEAEKVKKVFTDHEFSVSWDGTQEESVSVNLV